ncbi:MAG: hypothetical protein QMB11_07435 [Nonlabens sp.]|uniref:beta strand repeat-containing protein n=1 Tax=Nonlabens sp. TaxID=1888209 RepID=UPI0035A5B78F
MDSNFTKKAALLAVVGMAATTMSAQQLKKIGGNPYIIAPTAVFEIESADKGFLMPRITSLARTSMTGMAEGLQVYDLGSKSVWIHNGTNWVNSLTNSLPPANLFVGDANGVATGVALSGDVSILNTGAASIVADAVTTVKILNAAVTNDKLDKANIPLSGFGAAAADVDLGTSFKLINVLDPVNAQDAATKKYVDDNAASNTLADANVFVGNGSNVATAVALSGVVAIDNAGLTSIVDGTILAADIASDAVTTAKILDGTILSADIATDAVTTVKILSAAVTDAKLDKANIPVSGFAAAAADVDLGTSFKLINVLDPVNAQDAATKKYVDDNAASNTLADANVFVGNGSNVATAVALSGVVAIDNAGLTSIVDGTILAADIASDAVTTAKILDGTILSADIATDAVTTVKILSAAVTDAKLDKANIPVSGFAAAAADVDLGTSFKLINVLDPVNAQDAATKNYVDTELTTSNALTNGNVFVGNVSGVATGVALSGVVAIDNAGLTSIVDGTIVTADIATDAVITAKILDFNVTESKIATDAVSTLKIVNTAVTDAKLDKANIPLSGFAAATADVAFGAFKLTGVAEPTLAQDAATKSYVDTASSKTAITTAAKTAAYTALVTDFTIVVNANGGGFELTLPAATDNTGKVYVISKRDDGTNSVSFTANPLLMADGTAVAAMNYATTIRVQSNGTNWLIIN